MVGDGCTDVHHVLDGAVNVDVVVLVAHHFLKHLEDARLADAGFGDKDVGDYVTGGSDDLRCFLKGHHRGEVDCCAHDYDFPS